LGPIDVAFLPMNERSFFRKRRGIIGNMSVREAFAMAAEREDSQYASRFGDRRFASLELFFPKSLLQEALDVANA
jgi:hypothetical protein